MGKILLGILFKIRDFFTNKFGSFFENFRDQETGKITFARPETLKKVTGYVLLALFLLIIVSKMIKETSKPSGGNEQFSKEVSVSNGVSGRDFRTGVENDPFKALNSITRDEFGESKRTALGERATGIDLSSTVDLADCDNLIKKLKAGTKLSSTEKTTMDQCLVENKLGLTEEEKKIAQKLNDDKISDKERNLLSKVLDNRATEEERAVAKDLASDDPLKSRKAQEAVDLGDEAIKALGKQIEGQPLSEAEQKLVNEIEKNAKNPIEKIADVAKDVIGGSEDTSLKSGDTPKEVLESTKPLVLPNSPDEAIKKLAEDIGNRDKLADKLEEELGKGQVKNSPIAEKLASGKQLTSGETKSLQDFTKRKQELETLRKIQNQRKEEFAKRAAKIQEALTQSVNTVQKTLPSGTFIEYEGTPVNCTTISKVKVKKKTVVAKKEKKEDVLDVNGRPLKPEEVEFIKLYRKNQYEVAKMKKDALSGPEELSKGLGEPVNLATVAGEGGTVAVQDLNTLFILKDGALKTFELTPDMKIPAILDSEILVSDKGKGTMVRFRTLADVPNPRTNKIEIQKGAILVARTGSFDKDTGKMDISVDKAVLGSGKTVSVNLSVASGDGSMGLSGQIYDTSGKYLTGAFISAFTAGAISFATQQYVAPYQASTNAGTALSGAGLSGAAEVATKISELMVSKLQNAASVFFVPKGIPVVLIPQ